MPFQSSPGHAGVRSKAMMEMICNAAQNEVLASCMQTSRIALPQAHVHMHTRKSCMHACTYAKSIPEADKPVLQH